MCNAASSSTYMYIIYIIIHISTLLSVSLSWSFGVCGARVQLVDFGSPGTLAASHHPSEGEWCCRGHQPESRSKGWPVVPEGEASLGPINRVNKILINGGKTTLATWNQQLGKEPMFKRRYLSKVVQQAGSWFDVGPVAILPDWVRSLVAVALPCLALY